MIHGTIHGITHGTIHWGIGREGKGMETNERFASILTVGSHDAPAISRPEVADDACLIEHLDFEPACACRCHRFEPPPVADWVLILSQTCACDLPGAMCNPCREDIINGGPVRYCPRCGADLTGRFEPLR